ncbi:MAG: DNA polymerase III subunit epsilon [Bacteroidetes bacterium HGW-Bacteroidetes-21]|nr:MAG: DNA polymerase III subunit epsilon [Bacteroidetes bacterium HGW-Bacteroidetes-21]
MKLSNKKPVVFFDVETTGLSILTDRIISISIIRVEPNQKETLKTFIVNPGIPIPPLTTEIHGITDEDVKDKPQFKEIAANLSKYFEGADIAGFNSVKFDVPILAEEFLRAGVDFNFKNSRMIDVQIIYHKKEPRDLKAAYKFYCKKDFTDAHQSDADTLATYEVFKAQLETYDDLKADFEEVFRFSSHHHNADLAGHIIFNDDNVEVFNFGKYKGMLVSEVFQKDPGYYGWILNGQFPAYTKKILTEIKLRSRL